MVEIQAKIDADRRMLENDREMAEEERNKVKADLEEKEDELKKAQYASGFSFSMKNPFSFCTVLDQFQ